MITNNMGGYGTDYLGVYFLTMYNHFHFLVRCHVSHRQHRNRVLTTLPTRKRLSRFQASHAPRGCEEQGAYLFA